MNDVYGIAAFRSRQQVLYFEDVLRKNGISAGIVTTPRAVALGCGLSVRYDIEDVDRVRNMLRRANPGNLIGLYRVEQDRARTQIVTLRK